MIYKLNTNLVPLFSGTYETQWDIEEIDDNGDELPASYDFNEFMRGIAHEYANHVQFIREELAIDWIKSLRFTGKYVSPREYNFSTDRLDFTVKIDQRKMVKYLKSLENNADYAQYLRDNYSSCDGFWSWTPDTWRGTLEAITAHSEYEDQAIGALIRWAGLQSNPENFAYMGNIEGAINENWRGNGYGGVDYWVECGECDKRMEYGEEGWKCANPECKEYHK